MTAAVQALLESGDIDEETTTTLVAAANRSCSVTFHRAFDCCTTEPVAALETLIRCVMLYFNHDTRRCAFAPYRIVNIVTGLVPRFGLGI